MYVNFSFQTMTFLRCAEFQMVKCLMEVLESKTHINWLCAYNSFIFLVNYFIILVNNFIILVHTDGTSHGKADPGFQT